MSVVIQVGRSWPGFAGISNLIILLVTSLAIFLAVVILNYKTPDVRNSGDSYSDAGLSHSLPSPSSHPSPIQPLGILFPGLTYNEFGLPNWVGHLITKYAPAPRFKPEEEEQEQVYLDCPLLVYNYARGGDTILGVKHQIRSMFLPMVGKQPDWAPWTSYNSLFITWVGINDCAYSRKHDHNVNTLFVLQEELYSAGARNFLFIDIPPINRSPAVPIGRSDPTSFNNFNMHLLSGVRKFSASHPDITVMLFSASATFNNLLDEPLVYGFEISDCRKAGGGIWHDRLHPTSKVHDYLANDLADFIGSVAKCQTE